MGLATVRVAKYCTQHEIGIYMWWIDILERQQLLLILKIAYYTLLAYHKFYNAILAYEKHKIVFISNKISY